MKFAMPFDGVTQTGMTACIITKYFKAFPFHCQGQAMGVIS